MGSAAAEDARPHWVYVSPFRMAERRVTEGQFRSVNPDWHYRHPGRTDEVRETDSMTGVSWEDAVKFAASVTRLLGVRAGLPTEAEWEFAARGSAVNLREVMKKEEVKPRDFAEFAQGRFENFVGRLEMGARIMTDPADKRIREILKTRRPLYAWQVNPDPINDYGLSGMTGGVWEYVADWFDVYAYDLSSKKNPTGPAGGEYRVIRGISGKGAPALAHRSGKRPEVADISDLYPYGFRLAAAPVGT